MAKGTKEKPAPLLKTVQAHGEPEPSVDSRAPEDVLAAQPKIVEA